MENIDVIYYINLDSRTDRKEQFEEEIKKFVYPTRDIVRVSGIPTPGFGILGCGLSHKKALEMFIASGHQIALIFEDDFTFTLDMNYVDYLIRSLFEERIQFDVVMLAGNIMKSEKTPYPFLEKVLDGQTASGFLVTRSFAPKILKCLEESTVLLEDWHKKYNEKKHEYCNDIYWKVLQPESRWYIFKPKMGLQRESYSDNEQKITNYRV
jgi:GR25 family glycosyltransferase involved in LPS biosynthesis